MQYKHPPILSRDYQALESVQKLAVRFVKGLRHIPYETALQRLQLLSLVLESEVTLPACATLRTAFSAFHAMQSLLPLPTLGFEVILSRFTNSGVGPVAANVRSAFE